MDFACTDCLLVTNLGIFVITFLVQPFPSDLYELLEECLPFYNLLKHHTRRTPSSKLSPELPSPHLRVLDNKKVLVWVGNELVPRDSAKVCLLIISL